MTDFLFELLSEEIPARMQAKARTDLERLFADEIAKSGLKAEAIETHATPRRLVLIARGLPKETAAVSDELKGPRASAPPQALEGFLRKTGLSREQLVERDGVLFAVIDKPGRATADVLAEAIPAMIRAFPWPKSMRWGEASLSTASLRWVRPLQGIVALLGDDLVELEIDGISSGTATVGHRFHHPGPITIGSAHDYVEKLRACHVIISHEERQRIIRDGAAKAAAAAGLSVIPDEGLVQENAGLTEYPVPLLGSFDPAFLDVPREVIQLTMRTNQKYFALADGEGRLAPNFICTANIEPTDGGTAIAAGNAKVLAARLSDAKFFWEQDLKTPLEEQAKKLDQIVFHEKLGTLQYRVKRAVGLAKWLHSRNYLSGFDERELESAAFLAKADLVTGTVGEFPELQAIIGAHIAALQGASTTVVTAIRDQYRPVGPSDHVPEDPLAVALALSDKLYTICGFFAAGLAPSGSSDPFALRRTALGVIRIILSNNLRIPLTQVINVELMAPFFAQVRVFGEGEKIEAEAVLSVLHEFLHDEEAASLKIRDARFSELLESLVPQARAASEAGERLMAFFADRLKVQQREAGIRHDLIDAVFALGGEDDLVRLLARVKALQSFIASDDGANLLTGYKRAANILKKEGWDGASSPPVTPAKAGVHGSSDDGATQAGRDMDSRLRGNDDGDLSGKSLSYTPEAEEAALIAALDAAEVRASSAVATEDFEGAMAALAALRVPIDAFFEKVTVNDPDPDKRSARLALLARIRDAVHKVADFSRIEG